MARDDQIIVQILAGKTSEFRKLVERYQQPVFRFTRNLIRDDHDAEDLTQEVFLAAFNHLASFDSKRASVQTWLFTITRNRCVNYMKRKRPLVDGDVGDHVSQATYGHEASRNEFWRHLDDALDALPLDQKSAFVLAEVEGLPYADIAEIEQTTLGTVKSRIHRAKRHLRAVLAPTMRDQS